MSKPIALVVFTPNFDDNMSTKLLFSEEEIEAVRDSSDEEIGNAKAIIVMMDLTTEDYQ